MRARSPRRAPRSGRRARSRRTDRRRRLSARSSPGDAAGDDTRPAEARRARCPISRPRDWVGRLGRLAVMLLHTPGASCLQRGVVRAPPATLGDAKEVPLHEAQPRKGLEEVRPGSSASSVPSIHEGRDHICARGAAAHPVADSSRTDRSLMVGIDRTNADHIRISLPPLPYFQNAAGYCRTVQSWLPAGATMYVRRRSRRVENRLERQARRSANRWHDVRDLYVGERRERVADVDHRRGRAVVPASPRAIGRPTASVGIGSDCRSALEKEPRCR